MLNSIAKKVIDEQKDRHPEFVFTNRKNKQYTVYGTRTWKKAWDRAGMPSDKLINTGVENLKRTFEYRLLAAGVPPQTIDILRGSTKAEIYERGLPLPIEHLAECVEKITVPKETVIAQAHGRRSDLNKARWVDKRKLPGKREKGKRIGEPSTQSPTDQSHFELTGN